MLALTQKLDCTLIVLKSRQGLEIENVPHKCPKTSAQKAHRSRHMIHLFVIYLFFIAHVHVISMQQLCFIRMWFHLVKSFFFFLDKKIINFQIILLIWLRCIKILNFHFLRQNAKMFTFKKSKQNIFVWALLFTLTFVCIW